MFTWQKNLEFGIDIIDSQHQGIFDEVNKLVNSFKEGNETEQAYEMLCFLEDYVKKHFSTEEFYMEKYNCSGFDEHKKEHSDFTEKLLKLKTDYQMIGITKSAAIDIGNMLIDWCKTHIMRVDAKCVPEIGAKMRAEQNDFNNTPDV